MATAILRDPTSRRRRATVKPSSNGHANGNGAANGKAKPVDRAMPDAKAAVVPVSQILVGPFNPRVDFDAAKIAELAASIRQHGVLEPLLVRPCGSCYELVAGERRLRAAVEAGIGEVPVRIAELTDREAHEVAAIENLQRDDLSAIEEARAYRALLAGDDAPTQTALAERLGVSQGQIANRLRLLALPESVQGRVISGEIPAGHARELCRYAAHPKLVEQLVESAIEAAGQDGGLPPAEKFAEEVADEVLWKHGRKLYGEKWDQKSGKRIPYFTPTDAERAELEILEVPDPYGKPGATREVALNAALWDALQKEHVKQWLAQQRQKAKPKQAPAKKPPEKMTAAEKERAAKEEVQRAAEQARQFARRLYGWRCDWQRYLIAEQLRSENTEVLLSLLVTAAYQWHASAGELPGLRGTRVWSHVAKGQDPEAFAAKAAAALFWQNDFSTLLGADDAGGPSTLVPNGEVEEVFAWLGLDLETAWLSDQAGPLSEAYWTMHTKDQLAGLAKELLPKDAPALPAKKSDLVAMLLSYRPAPDATEVGLPLPKEIKKAKKPKGCW